MRRLVAAVALASVAALGLTGCAPAHEYDTAKESGSSTCTVTDKDRAHTEHGTSYRLYTSCGVFTVSDSLWHGQLNSADLYGRIEVGKTYRLTAYGYRSGFLSMFPNVTDATEVSK